MPRMESPRYRCPVLAMIALAFLCCQNALASEDWVSSQQRPEPLAQQEFSDVEKWHLWGTLEEPLPPDEAVEVDPWWKKYMESEKARAIEENLGIYP